MKRTRFVLGFMLTLPLNLHAQEQASSENPPQMFLISPEEYNLNDFNTENGADIKKPHLSVEETKQLSSTFKGIFSSLYVNNDYIAEKPKLQQDLDLLTNTNLYENRKNFMMTSVKFFQELNDLHTGLNLGYPYNCFISGFPLKTKRIYDPISKNYKFVISEKGDLDAILNAIKNENFADEKSKEFYQALSQKFNLSDIQSQFKLINVGDEIISMTTPGIRSNNPDEQNEYNNIAKFNIDFSNNNSIVNMLSPFTRTHWSNEGTTLSRASDLVFSRFGGTMQIPGSSNIPNHFILETNNGFYTFPWFTFVTHDLLNDSNNMCVNMINQKNPNVFVTGGTSDYPTETFLNAVKPSQELEGLEANSETIHHELISYQNKTFAYIQVKEFLPSKMIDPNYKRARLQILQSVAEVKAFVTENKNKISGIIFDIRNNPGGYGSYASALGKLFKTKFNYEDFLFYPLSTPSNIEMYHNLYHNLDNIVTDLEPKDRNQIDSIFKSIFQEFQSPPNYVALNAPSHQLAILDHNFDSDPNDSLDLILKAINNDPSLSAFKNLFNPSDAIYDGDAKHVAVLINGSSFSSSDIFTAIFKNYGIAKIYGEDTEASGGGGANVIFYNQFNNDQSQTGIIPLFQGNELVPGKTAPALPNDMFLSFAWNRVIGMKCFSANDDCKDPENPSDFIEKYYFDHVGLPDVNGVPVDVVLHKTIEDINQNRIENQPIFIDIMKDLSLTN